MGLLSNEQKLLALNKFAESVWFGYFILKQIERKEAALLFALEAPEDVGGLCKREQALGEINGCKHFQADFIQVRITLQEEISKQKESTDI